MKLKIGNKELNIKFAYKPTLKEHVISNVVRLSEFGSGKGNKGMDLTKIEDFLLYLPELLLVGVQANHKEYRYNYDTKEGKQEQLDKMFSLIDEYTTSTENADLIGLFTQLQDELVTDSFLASLFRQEQKAVKEAKGVEEN